MGSYLKHNCIILCGAVLCCVVLRCVISNHTIYYIYILYRIASHHIISHHVISYHIILYHDTEYNKRQKVITHVHFICAGATFSSASSHFPKMNCFNTSDIPVFFFNKLLILMFITDEKTQTSLTYHPTRLNGGNTIVLHSLSNLFIFILSLAIILQTFSNVFLPNRRQDNAWTNVDHDAWRHMASQSHNELIIPIISAELTYPITRLRPVTIWGQMFIYTWDQHSILAPYNTTRAPRALVYIWHWLKSLDRLPGKRRHDESRLTWV